MDQDAAVPGQEKRVEPDARLENARRQLQRQRTENIMELARREEELKNFHVKSVNSQTVTRDQEVLTDRTNELRIRVGFLLRNIQKIDDMLEASNSSVSAIDRLPKLNKPPKKAEKQTNVPTPPS